MTTINQQCNNLSQMHSSFFRRGYNLRGAIFANHQISHLAVIFAIIKFANHCMYRVTFCVARSIYAPVAYRYFDYKRQAVSLYSGVMESEAVGLFTVESVTTFARRCGQV